MSVAVYNRTGKRNTLTSENLFIMHDISNEKYLQRNMCLFGEVVFEITQEKAADCSSCCVPQIEILLFYGSTRKNIILFYITGIPGTLNIISLLSTVMLHVQGNKHDILKCTVTMIVPLVGRGYKIVSK